MKVSVSAAATEKVGLALLGKTTNTPKKPITLPQNLDQIDEAAGKMEQVSELEMYWLKRMVIVVVVVVVTVLILCEGDDLVEEVLVSEIEMSW